MEDASILTAESVVTLNAKTNNSTQVYAGGIVGKLCGVNTTVKLTSCTFKAQSGINVYGVASGNYQII